MALVAAVVLAAIAVGLLVWRAGKHTPAASPASPAGTESSGRRLSLAGRDFVPLAVDEKALDDLVDAIARQDNDKLEALVAAKRVLRVRNQTGVRVLAMQSGRASVQVTEGDHILQQGWVPEGWVR